MHATRTHVTKPQAEVLGKLALCRQIPLQDVIAMRVRLEVSLAKRVGRCGNDIECSGWKGARRQIRSTSQTIKGCGEEFIELDDVGQRQYVEDSEPSAQRRLAIAEWVPGDSYTRLKVASRGVGKQRITQVGRSVRELPENRQFSMDFCRYGGHFIPQAQ